MKIATWILTFNRPVVLERLMMNLNNEGITPNVFSNHPDCFIPGRCNIDRLVINSLNNELSNSWCARSWNSIFIKAFVEDKVDAIICLQDDTNIRPGFLKQLIDDLQLYDFISGPAGDQFFYITKDVLRHVHWWDERYIGCYCGDAEFFKRVYLNYDRDRVSQKDTHSWGWSHNPARTIDYIDTEYQTKTCEPNYENQHWALAKIGKTNKTLLASQAHYKNRWGVELDNNGPANINGINLLTPNIDWYPAMSAILDFTQPFYDGK
jgi:hypothetical protein